MTTAGTIEALVRDVRYAGRGLFRSPLLAILALLTLGIGIGASTAVFSVVDGVLLKPLPYPDSERLVSVWHDAPGAAGLAGVAGGLNFSPSMLVTYREEARSFGQIGLWFAQSASVTGLGEPEEVPAAQVTGQVLAALGVPPLLGRWLDEGDENPNKSPVTMLGYRYWQERFGGDPNVVGKPITVNGATFEIVGVMPKGFRIADQAFDIIGPFRFDPARLIPPPFCCNGIARLKDGVTLEQANADLERLLPRWIERFPFAGGVSGKEVYLDTWKIAPDLRFLKADVIGNVGNVLWVVLAMIAIVLVIACANVANLLLVRAERRKQELAVRATLGAGRWRIARVLLAESGLLALGGGVLGIALAYGGLALLLELAPPRLPRLADIALDYRALAFALAVAIGAAVLLGLVPVSRAAGLRLSSALRSGARGASGSRAEHRTQNVLVVGQVALALVLLVTSGLMIRTFVALRGVEPGFGAPETLQTFRVQIPPQVVGDARDVMQQERAIVDAIAALPGVRSAAFVSGLPMAGDLSNWDGLDAESRPDLDFAQQLHVFRQMSPRLLETMGTRLVAGRELEWRDLEDDVRVALVSENLARELWGDPQAAIGQRIRPSGGDPSQWREVVGVVEDVRMNGLDQAPPTVVYWPALMGNFYRDQPFFVARNIAVVVRSPRAGTMAFARELEQAVWSVNASLPVAGVRTMQEIYDRSLARTSFTLVMLALAAGAALVLGVVGLYGVLSYAVAQRRREIAIRLALGARARDVRRRFVLHGVSLAGIGVLIGFGGAAAAARLMASLLFDVRPVDPSTYVVVGVALTLAAAIASYVPAQRASNVDPAESLAAE